MINFTLKIEFQNGQLIILCDSRYLIQSRVINQRHIEPVYII